MIHPQQQWISIDPCKMIIILNLSIKFIPHNSLTDIWGYCHWECNNPGIPSLKRCWVESLGTVLKGLPLSQSSASSTWHQQGGIQVWLPLLQKYNQAGTRDTARLSHEIKIFLLSKGVCKTEENMEKHNFWLHFFLFRFVSWIIP